MKETHPAGSDRNTASPTESAVCERLGTGTLRSRLSELYHCRVITEWFYDIWHGVAVDGRKIH